MVWDIAPTGDGFMASNDRRTHGNQHAHIARKVFRVSSSCPVAPAGDARRPLRAHLLNGASSVALSVASMIVALGVCMPGNARAQTTVNPNQTTTFTLDPLQNPIVFGAGTNIDTSATIPADAIFGGAGTAWDVTTQGTIQGNRRGVSLGGAGSSLINSGAISETSNFVDSGAVVLDNGGTVTNQQNGAITALSVGVEIDGARGTVINASTITATDGAGVLLVQSGDVTNQQGGKITGAFFGVRILGLPDGTVTNADEIKATDTAGNGVDGLISSVTNQTGGKITGGATGDGVHLRTGGTTVTNEQNATISGGANGISTNGSVTVTNDGSITGDIAINAQFGTATVTNGTATGTNGARSISGVSSGIFAKDITVIGNIGTIEATGTGAAAISAANSVDVINSKTIQAIGLGQSAGISVSLPTGTATVHNLSAGTISGNAFGIHAANLNVINESGATISSAGVGIQGSGTITNGGKISGTSGSSIVFGGTGTNTLTLQTGSELVGAARGAR